MATDQEEKRSSKQIYIYQKARKEGVGARQKKTLFSAEGGGYLDSCTGSEVTGTLQLFELKAMGIGSAWLGIAELIGVPEFLKIWRFLDSCDQGVEHNGQVRVTVPRFTTFMKYQRNQVIRTLDAAGKTPAEIRGVLAKEHSIDVHIRTVERAIGR